MALGYTPAPPPHGVFLGEVSCCTLARTLPEIQLGALASGARQPQPSGQVGVPVGGGCLPTPPRPQGLNACSALNLFVRVAPGLYEMPSEGGRSQ